MLNDWLCDPMSIDRMHRVTCSGITKYAKNHPLGLHTGVYTPGAGMGLITSSLITSMQLSSVSYVQTSLIPLATYPKVHPFGLRVNQQRFSSLSDRYSAKFL